MATKAVTPKTNTAGARVVKRRSAAERDLFTARTKLLFTLPGIEETDPDQEFFVPETFPASKSVWALEQFRVHGEAVGMVMLIRDVLGDPAYNALIESPDLTKDDLDAIFSDVAALVLGSEKTQGK